MSESRKSAAQSRKVQPQPLSPRIVGIMRGRPPHEQVQLALLASIAGPEVTAAIMNEVVNPGIDYDSLIPEADNLPVREFVGRSRKDIARMLGDDENKIDAVEQAFEERGMEIPDELPARTLADEADDRARGTVLPAAPPDGAPMSRRLMGGVAEKTFGSEQFPASDIWHLPEDELRDMDLSPADINELRRLRGEHDARLAASRSAATGQRSGVAPIAGDPATSTRFGPSGLSETIVPERQDPALQAEAIRRENERAGIREEAPKRGEGKQQPRGKSPQQQQREQKPGSSPDVAPPAGTGAPAGATTGAADTRDTRAPGADAEREQDRSEGEGRKES